MKSAIRNNFFSATIEVDAAVPLLRVNGSIDDSFDIREAELFYHIIDSHPKILTYDKIIEQILKKYGVADDLYSDPIHYIRKKKLGLGKFLSKVTGLKQEDIIINVRKVGYRLKTGWERVDSFSSEPTQQYQSTKTQKQVKDGFTQLDLLLAELSSLKCIIEETVKLSKRLEFRKIHDQSGNVTLVLNQKGYEADIAALDKKFSSNIRTFISFLAINPLDSRHIRILNILVTMYSYITMSRQGTNITEDNWRMLFENELKTHYECLVAECVLPNL